MPKFAQMQKLKKNVLVNKPINKAMDQLHETKPINCQLKCTISDQSNFKIANKSLKFSNVVVD